MRDIDSLQTKCTPEQNRFIEELFRSEHKDMFEFAYHTLGDENLADVAVQDTFLIALKKPNSLCNSPNPVGWLYNTIKNVILHIERDRNYLYKKNISLHEDTTDLASYMDTYSEVCLEVGRSDEWKLLTQFYIEGYSIRELAEKYGISEEACKSRLKRARMKLRKKLK
ncbi:MAG: RNA polymerase sigma factor [Faecousia sp.]